MEKGLSKHWTPEMEASFQRLLDAPLSFAERYMIRTAMHLVKYDGRSHEAKKAQARDQLMLAAASGEELRELANLQYEHYGKEAGRSADQMLEELLELREQLRARGIPKELIEKG